MWLTAGGTKASKLEPGKAEAVLGDLDKQLGNEEDDAEGGDG